MTLTLRRKEHAYAQTISRVDQGSFLSQWSDRRSSLTLCDSGYLLHDIGCMRGSYLRRIKSLHLHLANYNLLLYTFII